MRQSEIENGMLMLARRVWYDDTCIEISANNAHCLSTLHRARTHLNIEKLCYWHSRYEKLSLSLGLDFVCYLPNKFCNIYARE